MVFWVVFERERGGSSRSLWAASPSVEGAPTGSHDTKWHYRTVKYHRIQDDTFFTKENGKKIKKGDEVLIMGDFNARVGRFSEEYPKVVGKYLWDFEVNDNVED